MDTAEASVDAVRDIGSGGVAVDITTPAGFAAQPGQFVKLTATVDGEEVSSIYTISSPTVERTFEITVDIDPEGALGPWLADGREGEPVGVSGPFGSAHYEGEGSVVVLAGGPGIGPALAIAERVVSEGGSAAIVYQDDEPFHRDRLDDLERAGATVRVLATDEELTGPVRDAVADTSAEQVFVYGFGTFVEAARGALEAAGAPASDAKVENFG
ncbi:FAD-dependent oxidoreductase [Haloglomus litoreum]|uniref:FAD-dependent oxidoreductase n=1 Tax=Haloglomus litoreum TaxID=3034026 RepID=UPI0023E76330|nr:FAD-dependent oxidoreductase [Haloglomus sp. DT116]